MVEDTIIDLKNRSPRATIGNEKRFFETNEQMIVNYKGPVPVQHINEAAKCQKLPAKMGVIGNATRMHPERYVVNSPGVGAYDMDKYASFAKAKQTSFHASRNHKSSVT